MDHALILDLLQAYHDRLTLQQAQLISTYIDILLRWNAKMNLTAVRDPKQIVTRHFGEALFLARCLADRGLLTAGATVLDIGSGAGFPAIPIKIACPQIALTLVEAHGRKAVFLKEVLRALGLDGEVKNVRAEDLAETSADSADVVTMRAVEKFETVLPIAARFAKSRGTLAVLIGKQQVPTAQYLLKFWHFEPLLTIPGAESRGIALMNQIS